jgi:hypothetical protein
LPVFQGITEVDLNRGEYLEIMYVISMVLVCRKLRVDICEKRVQLVSILLINQRLSDA